MTNTDEQPASPDQRKAALARAVQAEVAAGGTVESQADYSAVIRWHKNVNHVLHLLLTLLTLGFWAFVWIGIVIYAVTQRKAVALEVDEYGHLLRQRIG